MLETAKGPRQAKSSIPAKRTARSTATKAAGIDAQQRIAQRAYELYEQCGRIDGRDEADWLQAEREVG